MVSVLRKTLVSRNTPSKLRAPSPEDGVVAGEDGRDGGGFVELGTSYTSESGTPSTSPHSLEGSYPRRVQTSVRPDLDLLFIGKVKDSVQAQSLGRASRYGFF